MTFVIDAPSNCARAGKKYWQDEKYGKALLKGFQARGLGVACAGLGLPCLVLHNVTMMCALAAILPLMGEGKDGKKALETAAFLAFDMSAVLIANVFVPEFVAAEKLDKLAIEKLYNSSLAFGGD